MAAFLSRALRLDTKSPYLGLFEDIEAGAWYTSAVEAMGARRGWQAIHEPTQPTTYQTLRPQSHSDQ
ncbi:MAG: hypothetical protein KTV45_14775 [Acidimicrobiia bacterium]|nr:hypothetical protein [Acidimicrobiia bacterium]